MSIAAAKGSLLAILQQLVARHDFSDLINQAFGSGYSQSNLDQIRENWLSSEPTLLPTIAVVPADRLSGAAAAYAAIPQTILLSDSFLAKASADELTRVLLEEIGHFIDSQINAADSSGDEGSLFAALVLGEHLSTPEQQSLRSEDDHGIVILNNGPVAVEFSGDTTAPVLSGALPTADVAAQLILSFSETIQPGSSGQISLFRGDGTLIETFAAASSNRLLFAGNTISIDPTWDLNGSSDYYFTLNSGCVVDLGGNGFNGVSDSSTLAFRTAVETPFSLGDSFIRDDFPGTAAEVIGDHRVLYMRVTYTDVNRSSTSLGDAKTDMERASSGFIETSKGRMPLSTIYTPVLTLPFSHEWMSTFDNSLNGLGFIQTAARDEATKLGFNIGDYDTCIVRVDTSLRSGASWGGGSSVWLGWGGEDVILHEVGHALGIGHANSIDWDGNDVEYGNDLDQMGGGGGSAAQFGVNTQLNLGWIDSGDTTDFLTLNAGVNPLPGIYRIHAMDAGRKEVGRSYALRQIVPYDILDSSNPSTYTLEYRPRYGGDLARSVVLLRNDQIIDLTPATSSQIDAGIQLGQTYQIPGGQSYFSVLNVGDGFIDVSYQQGPFLDNVAPSISLTASATTVKRFDAVTFTANAADGNGDALLYFWQFSDGVNGTGRSYSRSFNQSAPQTLTATLTVSDQRGGTASLSQALSVGASSTGSPITIGGVNAISLAKPRVAIVAADAFAAEGGDSASLVISRIGSSLDAPLLVNLSYFGSGLSAFATPPTSATIAAGQSSTILTLTPSDDDSRESRQSLQVSLVAAAAYDISSQNSNATVTINDNDTPVVSIEAIDPSAAEPSGGSGRDTGMFLISRSGPTTSAMTVYYGLTGTANNGADFARLDGQAIIAAGQSSVTVMVNAMDDAEGELSESVTLTLATFNNTYSVGPANSATVSIRDGDDLPTVSVRATSSNPVEGASGSFTITAVGGSEAFSVAYAIGGSASNGSDYSSLSGSVTIPAGGGTRTVTIPVQTIADGLNENDESLTFRILGASSYTIGLDDRAQLQIDDAIDLASGGDRVRVSRHIAGAAALGDPSEDGPKGVEFYIYRENETNQKQALTVTYSLNGTATPGVDYSGIVRNAAGSQLQTFTPAASNTLTIPANELGLRVLLVPTVDNLFEGSETITLSLQSVSGAKPFYPLGINRDISVVLLDKDISSRQLGFATSSSLIGEQLDPQGNKREILVTLSQASATPVSVQYRPSGGSALGYNSDFTFLDPSQNNAEVQTGTLTFAPGETSKTISLRVNADRIAESQESFGILLENPFGATLKPGANSHIVTVFDIIPPGLIKEERWNGTAIFTNNTWDSQPANYTGYLTGFTSAKDVSDNYSRRLSGIITVPTTGSYTFYISGDDDARLFLGSSAAAASRSANPIATVPLNGWTNFQQWNKYTSQQANAMTLTAGQQLYMEVQQKENGGGDHVSVGWTGPGISAITPIVTSPAALASAENRYLRFLSDSSTIVEGANGVIMVSLDRANDSGNNISVAVELIAGGSATQGADFVLATTTLLFAPGESSKAIPVAALADASNEAAESISVRLVNANGAQILNPSHHQVTILDANAPFIRFEKGIVQANDTAGTLITTANANLASGRTLASWQILSGNPRLEGHSTPAFAIDAQGRITVANAAALPLGSYELSLRLRATDNLGSSSLSTAKIVVGGNRIVEERWNDYGSAYNNRDWSATPDVTQLLTAFDAEQNVADDYSRRITGVFTVPTSGAYSFWITAGDVGRLTLAPFNTPDAEQELASSNDPSPKAWDETDNQQSPPQQLLAGQRYILRAYQLEDYWGDHLSVAWSGPGISRRLMTESDFLPAQPSRFIQTAALNADQPESVSTYLLSPTAITDAGLSASILSGSYTRDSSLGLSGTAVAGSTVTIYDGVTAIAATRATAQGTWAITTPSLSNGAHSFRAEVVDSYGNIAITKSETFNIRSQIKLGGELLVSTAPGSNNTLTTATTGLGSVKGQMPVDQGVLVYDLPTGPRFEEQRWAGQAVYTNNSWDTLAASSSSTLTSLTTPQNVGDDYSRRIRGTIIAPATGSYTFYLASDDNGRLYLSSNDAAANKVQIASVSGWTDFQQWNKYASQTSASISLTAGQSYYIEVQQQEGSGGDHLSVGWRGPGISDITPISISGNLVVADASSGSGQLVNRGATDPNVVGSSAIAYAGLSANGRHVVYGTNAVSSFGNAGANFSDTSNLSAGPYSDLIGFDRLTGSTRLLTAGGSASTSRSRQAQLVGISADQKFAVFTSNYAEAIGNFTTPGKPQPTSWALVEGGYPSTAGKTKLTSLRVADIDPSKLSFALSGGWIDNDGVAATVSSGAGIARATGQLSFWVQALDGGTTTKAVKLELQDAADGILVKATAAKFTSGNQPNFNWNSSGSTGSVATSLGGSGYGVSLLEAQAGNLTEQMRAESLVASTDLLATNLASGEQLLLSHSASPGHLQSLAANVSQVSLSADGKTVFFAANDASKLGNNGLAFSDSAPAVADLFAANLQTGLIRLLSHSAADPTASAGTAVTLRGSSANGAFAVFSVNDASAFGFSDNAPTSGDLISVNLSDGSFRLLSRASMAASSSSSAQAVSFEQISGNHVYFSANDATKLGFNSDGNTSKADLFRVNLTTGALELLSHVSSSSSSAIPITSQALNAAYLTGSLTVSPDGRYVAFAVDMQSNSGGFTVGVSGTALLLTDRQTGAIRILNASNDTGTHLSYGAWGDIENNARFFTPDSTALVWQHSYLGWMATEGNSYGSGADSQYTLAALLTDLSAGMPAAGQISTTRILSHTAASKQQIAPSVTLLGVSEDSRLAFFSANNASSFGNDGLAFSDSAATAGDLFAVNLANRQIELISGQNLASFGQSATYLGNGEGGSVLYSLGNVSGIQTPTGLLSDGNGTGTDVMAARFNLIDLVNKDDTLNSDGSGSRTDNITRKTFFTLKSWATPGLAVQLKDGANVVASQTAGSDGSLSFALSNVAIGSHTYSLWYPTEGIPITLASALGASSLTVTVLGGGFNQSPTGSVSISGNPTEGQTLSAANNLADADGIPTSGANAIAYQWRADGNAIAGATGPSLLLSQALVGKAISITASYIDDENTPESITSAATAAVANINDSPTGSVSISGNPTQGQTLSAANSLADADGIPSSGANAIAYQWRADGNAIAGATGPNLLLSQALVGKAISVTASYIDGGNTAESVTSAATGLVTTLILGLELAGDTGSSATDRLTNNRSINVLGLSSGTAWQFSTNAGTSWSNGSGSSFLVNAGTYATGQVRVRRSATPADVVSNFPAFTVDTTAPGAVALSLAADTGRSSTDRLTNNANLAISGMEAGASWQFSTDAGSSWTNGSGSSFSVAPASYATGRVRVRQIDAAGNSGAALTTFAAFTVDTIALPPTLNLANDSGSSSGDRYTNDPTLLISGLEQDASWQFSTNAGATWTSGSGNSFVVATAAYTAGQVSVRQIDAAGNSGAALTTFAAFTVDVSDPLIPNLALTTDTGVSSNDRLTSQAMLAISGLETGASWQFSTDGGSSWSTGSGTNFSVPAGDYGEAQVQVRQIDRAGNIGDANSSFAAFTVDSSAPDAPSLALVADTGASGSDRLTNAASLSVNGLEAAATWQFSINSGSSWTAGLGNSFSVAAGSYTDGQVMVRQSDAAGNSGAPLTSFAGFTIDTTAPAAPSLALAADSGRSNTDRLTANPNLLVSGLEAGASWQYSSDSGSSWRVGSGSSFSVDSAAYTVGRVQVRQIDAAGNFGVPLTSFAAFTVDAIAPAAPILALAADTGSSSGDRLTRNRSLTLRGLEPGALWQYSTDRGATWTTGSGTSFSIAPGSYASGQVQARQIDLAANTGAALDSFAAFSIDTAAPARPTLALVADTGSSTTDRLTNNPSLAIGGLEAGASWQYSTDAGSTWTPGSGSSFTVAAGSYARGAVRVRQIDTAGNSGASLSSFAAFSVDTSAPAISGLTVGGSDSTITSQLSDQQISGTSTAGQSVAVRHGGTILGTTVANSSGLFSYSLTPANIQTIGQGSGKTLSFADPAGNVSAILSPSFSVDTLNGSATRDTLTGIISQSDSFSWQTLSQSILSAYDSVSNYEAADRIVMASFATPTTLLSSKGSLTALNASNISALLNDAAFPTASAAAFTVIGSNGTFVAINDSTAGFQQTTDAILFLASYALSASDPITLF